MNVVERTERAAHIAAGRMTMPIAAVRIYFHPRHKFRRRRSDLQQITFLFERDDAFTMASVRQFIDRNPEIFHPDIYRLEPSVVLTWRSFRRFLKWQEKGCRNLRGWVGPMRIKAEGRTC